MSDSVRAAMAAIAWLAVGRYPMASREVAWATPAPERFLLACGHRVEAAPGVVVWNYYDGRWTSVQTPDRWKAECDPSGMLPGGVTWWFSDVDQTRCVCTDCGQGLQAARRQV